MSSFDAGAIRALVFDVFGTVVDWRASIVREGEALAAARGWTHVDWPAFADAWRAGYQPAMQRARSGEIAWTNVDGLHRNILDTLIPRFGLEALNEAERADLNRVWHRLDPWPDAVPGLTRLKEKFTITTLSNGNVSLLTNMAKRAGLPWDCVISAELFHHYKPDPQAYRGCADLLDVPPDQLMLVAAHPGDLRAARAAGLRTAFVARPLEHGPGRAAHRIAPDEFDVAATDFIDLAERLGA